MVLSSKSETEESKEVGPVQQQAGLVPPSNQDQLTSTVWSGAGYESVINNHSQNEEHYQC